MIEPWNPTAATKCIREVGKHPALSLAYKLHAKERMAERSIIISDVLYLLRNGFVYKDAASAKTNGYFKYEIECQTPNSANRSIRLVVIPNYNTMSIKIVTVMWVDEEETCAGSILGEEE